MIYFDHASTSPMLPEAMEAYTKASRLYFCNTGSLHEGGRSANNLLEEARSGILDLLGLRKTHDLLFVSGATEGNNLVLRGVLESYPKRGRKIISSPLEHPSLLRPLEILAKQGCDVEYLRPDGEGHIEPEAVFEAVDDETVLVSLMGANNEIGTLYDLKKIGEAVHKKSPKALFHSDVTQLLGRLKSDLSECDYLTFSAHKFGGPKGHGGVIYRKNCLVSPIIYGGDQEKGWRPGTVDVPAIAASYVALREAYRKMEETMTGIIAINEEIRRELGELPDEVVVNSPEDGIPHILDFSLLKKKASVVVEALSREGIYVGTKSACSIKHAETSYVLRAIGKSEGIADNSIRLSFGIGNTVEEAEQFIATLKRILKETKDRG